ncbi:pilus assembly protein [Frankia sp. AgB1.9]|uniref:TadE/TadG family type IV pilus assembly protein n=1 Tax=unclassified Frankia TaxID=2632575 RepID=UPI0019338D17|nr:MULTISPECIES: TadE/TadG family type IV pilus assembly protein [unclassified Frankia]MBL7487775.1 pilus assembly protein [Frankia sp. AgW1.1]MBL7553715.1 pilus assembly protein [Frankia sp. AgB1.9]MBL7622935.1 pilus assembly protein [Frankia sp. AgB1.8]
MTRRPTAITAGRPRCDRGSATAELVLIMPVLVLMLMFLVLCYRISDAKLRLADAAHQAARAASIARTPTQAVTDAQATAQSALADAGVTCEHLTVDTDPAGLTPGGLVHVTITCTTRLDDLAVLAVPGSAALHASATSPVDLFGDQLGQAS